MVEDTQPQEHSANMVVLMSIAHRIRHVVLLLDLSYG